MAIHYYQAHHRSYSLSSSSEIVVFGSRDSRSPPTSGDYEEIPVLFIDCMGRWYHFLNAFWPHERRTLRATCIHMWREVLMFTAVAGATDTISLTDDIFEIMLNDRPSTAKVPWVVTGPHFDNLDAVPADLTGRFCVQGTWYHEC